MFPFVNSEAISQLSSIMMLPPGHRKAPLSKNHHTWAVEFAGRWLLLDVTSPYFQLSSGNSAISIYGFTVITFRGLLPYRHAP